MTMRISSSDTLAGIPLTEIRKLLTKSTGTFRRDWLEDQDFSYRKSLELVKALVSEGYLELDESERRGRHSKIPWYTATEKGRSLIRASAAKPILRATADKALQGVLARAQEINDSDEYAVRVTALVVFGSYLTDKDQLGDLDVAFNLEKKWPKDLSMDEFVKRIQEHARRSNRQFSSYMDELFWPEQQAQLYLKNRVRCISLQPWHSFVGMEKTPEFKYKALLGDAGDIASQLAKVNVS